MVATPIPQPPSPASPAPVPVEAVRPRVLGILNLTPDSFSDGGLWTEPARAVDHALEMIEQGADALDLGAESTRPGGGVYGTGAEEVPIEEEWTRLEPVLALLRRATATPLWVDTRKPELARRALAAGADGINDVGGLALPEMRAVVAAAACPVILMHARGALSTMQREIGFVDVVREVRDELAAARDAAVAAGVAPGNVCLDPGIGFGKTALQNRQLLRHLDVLVALGQPVLVGASRKSFLAAERPAPPRDRLGGSLAAAAWAALHGVAWLRVHDVAETVQFLDQMAAIAGTPGPGGSA